MQKVTITDINIPADSLFNVAFKLPFIAMFLSTMIGLLSASFAFMVWSGLNFYGVQI
jgi:hypothetical protein